MEGKNPHKSTIESKVFKIPIDKYEKDMDTESAKGKKNEILDLFNNYNKLRSEEEFNEIKYYLHDSCREGDVDLIKIYLSEKIENDSNRLQFKIDPTNRTASLFKVIEDIEEIIIPRTVEHESVEYLITSITGVGFYIKTLKFVEDSAIKTIYWNAFQYSKIEKIYFPTSLKELKKGWCSETNKLTKISISPSNGQFKIEEDKYLVGKNETNKDEFDNLLFVCRDIEEISIPSNIKIISSYAFEFCKKLTKVEIQTNSNLQTIESDAFSYTKIKEIYFPTSLRELKEGWCCNANNLTKIIISPYNGQFKIIDDKYLIGKSDPNKDEFDKLLFAYRDIEEISIPSNIKIISSYAFNNCKNLTKVEIPTNSNLQIIGSNSFYSTKINEIFISSKVSEICEHAFRYCSELTKVEIPTNSNLQIIESFAFSFTKIEKFFIPSRVSEICEFTFSYNHNLTKVIIPPNSNLQTIGSMAFYETNIKEIFIPSKVSEICEFAFCECSNLQIVEISEESNLESFPLPAFEQYSKCIIMIPTSLEKLIHTNK